MTTSAPSIGRPVVSTTAPEIEPRRADGTSILRCAPALVARANAATTNVDCSSAFIFQTQSRGRRICIQSASDADFVKAFANTKGPRFARALVEIQHPRPSRFSLPLLGSNQDSP